MYGWVILACAIWFTKKIILCRNHRAGTFICTGMGLVKPTVVNFYFSWSLIIKTKDKSKKKYIKSANAVAMSEVLNYRMLSTTYVGPNHVLLKTNMLIVSLIRTQLHRGKYIYSFKTLVPWARPLLSFTQ